MQLTIPGSGHIYIDEKAQIWWASDKPGVEPQLLADADSLCGMGIFETDGEDPFRDDCSVHDNFYRHRAFMELRGWTRESIDKYFLQLMLFTAQGDACLNRRAHEFYALVRMFGWIPYYKHITISPEQIGNEELLKLGPDELNEWLKAHPHADAVSLPPPPIDSPEDTSPSPES